MAQCKPCEVCPVCELCVQAVTDIPCPLEKDNDSTTINTTIMKEKK